jgi:hypothetical protein
MTLSG